MRTTVTARWVIHKLLVSPVSRLPQTSGRLHKPSDPSHTKSCVLRCYTCVKLGASLRFGYLGRTWLRCREIVRTVLRSGQGWESDPNGRKHVILGAYALNPLLVAGGDL